MARTIELSPKDMAKIKKTLMYYYRLKRDSERGEAFCAVVRQGMEADQKALELAESVGAEDIILSPFSDFGGIIAWLFPKKHRPDEEVFRETGEKTQDGRNIYEVAADSKVLFVRNDCMPSAEDPSVIEKFCDVKYSQIAQFKRKDIAQAIGMDLEYLHPSEALRLLDIDSNEIVQYEAGVKTMEDVLKQKLCKNRREERMKEIALLADMEHHKFLEQAKQHTYCIYVKIFGTEKAVQLYKECFSLPVVPSGTLNRVIGVENAAGRCGFFIYEDSIWIQSSGLSSCKDDEDFFQISGETRDMALKSMNETLKQKSKDDGEND